MQNNNTSRESLNESFWDDTPDNETDIFKLLDRKKDTKEAVIIHKNDIKNVFDVNECLETITGNFTELKEEMKMEEVKIVEGGTDCKDVVEPVFNNVSDNKGNELPDSLWGEEYDDAINIFSNLQLGVESVNIERNFFQGGIDTSLTGFLQQVKVDRMYDNGKMESVGKPENVSSEESWKKEREMLSNVRTVETYGVKSEDVVCGEKIVGMNTGLKKTDENDKEATNYFDEKWHCFQKNEQNYDHLKQSNHVKNYNYAQKNTHSPENVNTIQYDISPIQHFSAYKTGEIIENKEDCVTTSNFQNTSEYQQKHYGDKTLLKQNFGVESGLKSSRGDEMSILNLDTIDNGIDTIESKNKPKDFEENVKMPVLIPQAKIQIDDNTLGYNFKNHPKVFYLAHRIIKGIPEKQNRVDMTTNKTLTFVKTKIMIEKIKYKLTDILDVGKGSVLEFIDSFLKCEPGIDNYINLVGSPKFKFTEPSFSELKIDREKTEISMELYFYNKRIGIENSLANKQYLISLLLAMGTEYEKETKESILKHLNPDLKPFFGIESEISDWKKTFHLTMRNFRNDIYEVLLRTMPYEDRIMVLLPFAVIHNVPIDFRNAPNSFELLRICINNNFLVDDKMKIVNRCVRVMEESNLDPLKVLNSFKISSKKEKKSWFEGLKNVVDMGISKMVGVECEAEERRVEQKQGGFENKNVASLNNEFSASTKTPNSPRKNSIETKTCTYSAFNSKENDLERPGAISIEDKTGKNNFNFKRGHLIGEKIVEADQGVLKKGETKHSSNYPHFKITNPNKSDENKNKEETKRKFSECSNTNYDFDIKSDTFNLKTDSDFVASEQRSSGDVEKSGNDFVSELTNDNLTAKYTTDIDLSKSTENTKIYGQNGFSQSVNSFHGSSIPTGFDEDEERVEKPTSGFFSRFNFFSRTKKHKIEIAEDDFFYNPETKSWISKKETKEKKKLPTEKKVILEEKKEKPGILPAMPVTLPKSASTVNLNFNLTSRYVNKVETKEKKEELKDLLPKMNE